MKVLMFEFIPSIRLPFVLVGAGRRLRRCAATNVMVCESTFCFGEPTYVLCASGENNIWSSVLSDDGSVPVAVSLSTRNKEAMTISGAAVSSDCSCSKSATSTTNCSRDRRTKVFHRILTGSKFWAKCFRNKGVNGGQN